MGWAWRPLRALVWAVCLGVLWAGMALQSAAQTVAAGDERVSEAWMPPRSSMGPMIVRRTRMENPPQWAPPPRVSDAVSGMPVAQSMAVESREVAPAKGLLMAEPTTPGSAVLPVQPVFVEPVRRDSRSSEQTPVPTHVTLPSAAPAPEVAALSFASPPDAGALAGANPSVVAMSLSVQLANIPVVASQPLLTEDEAVLLALARHAGLEVWRQKSTAAAAMLETASVLNAPVLKLGRSDDVQDTGADSRKNKISLQWTPPQPGETGLRRDLLAKRKDEALALQHSASQRLVAEVKGLHMSLRIGSAMLDEAGQWADLLLQQHNLVSEQVKAQRKTQFDWVDAELKLAEAIARRARIRHESDQARGRLLALLGQPTGVNPAWSIAPDSLLAVVPRIAVTDVPSLLAAARQARPDVAALAARCDGVVAETRLLEMENRTWLKDVQLTVGQQPNQPSSWGVQIGVTLPFAGPKNGGVAVTAAQRATCAAEQSALEQSIQHEVQSALGRYETAWSQWSQQLAQVLPLTERAVGLGRQAKAVGRLDGAEMLALELRHVEARMTALTRLLELRQAELAVALVGGSLVVP